MRAPPLRFDAVRSPPRRQSDTSARLPFSTMLAAAASTKSKKPSSRKRCPAPTTLLSVLLWSCIALCRSRTEQSGRRRRWTTYLDSFSLRLLIGVASHGCRERARGESRQLRKHTTKRRGMRPQSSVRQRIAPSSLSSLTPAFARVLGIVRCCQCKEPGDFPAGGALDA
ncbi:hypothetical protein MTO96_022157 [Rhipicephalus appendiculatus]